MPLYASTIFLGAFLLFQVQPLIARFILPWFGGSAAVWTTCMLFFQVALVGGYLHAFAVHRHAPARRQGAIHVALLAGSLLLLPIIPAVHWRPAGDVEPISRILLLLGASVGLPYLLLAATGPLVQGWFAREFPGRSPYRLFALSNLASLLALVAFPLWVEPNLTSRQQAWAWSGAYVVFVVLASLVALRSRRLAPAAPPVDEPVAAPFVVATGATVRALWIVLPACASALLLAITNHLTQDLASLPLLWVLPLGLYLVTFIVAFDHQRWYRRAVVVPAAVCALAAMGWLQSGWGDEVELGGTIAVFAVGLALVCFVCHGELARLKPHPRRLTSYYLSISVGGALGGLLVGLGAPLLLSRSAEVEIGLAAFALLLPATIFVTRELDREPWRERRRWLAGAAMLVAAAFSVALLHEAFASNSRVRVRVRSFYGALRVVDYGTAAERSGLRRLVHGGINHGAQLLDPERTRWPTTYYCEDSGAGLALGLHHADRPRRIGVIGLGAGSLAVYGKAGDTFRFYDINPQVIALASSEFTFLSGSAAKIEIVPGDARLALEREEAAAGAPAFDVLLVDAFSGDSIPVHLLTREAFELYWRRLAPDGVLAVHVSNRHVNLAPVVEQAGLALGMESRAIDSDAVDEDDPRYCLDARWVLQTRGEALFHDARLTKVAQRIAPAPGYRMWTDDFSNLVNLLEWRAGGVFALPSRI